MKRNIKAIFFIILLPTWKIKGHRHLLAKTTKLHNGTGNKNILSVIESCSSRYSNRIGQFHFEY